MSSHIWRKCRSRREAQLRYWPSSAPALGYAVPVWLYEWRPLLAWRVRKNTAAPESCTVQLSAMARKVNNISTQLKKFQNQSQPHSATRVTNSAKKIVIKTFSTIGGSKGSPEAWGDRIFSIRTNLQADHKEVDNGGCSDQQLKLCAVNQPS